MSLVVVTRPRTTGLTTVARLKAPDVLNISGSALDASLEQMIDEATSLIEAECGKQFALAIVREGQQGDDATTMILTRRPVQAIEELTEDGETVPPEAYTLDDGPAGILFREDGFVRAAAAGGITRDTDPMRARERYKVRYRGGYRLPGDNISASGLAVASGSGNAIVLPANDPRAPWPILASGEQVQLLGFGQAANRGWRTVIARTDLALTFAETLTPETAPASAVVKTSTLPPALERFCVEAVKTWHIERTRSLNVTSERIGDWAATYASSEYSHVLPASVATAVVRLFGAIC